MHDRELRQRWAGMARQLGLRDDTGRATGDLLARYAEPSRHYHNAAHIAAVFAELDASGAPVTGTLAAAVLYHDAVYDPARGDNEERSADLAAEVLSSLRATGTAARDVRRLILVTKAHQPTNDEERLLVDADLSILGQDAPTFDAYERAIRQEYAHVPDPAFLAGRSAVLRKLLARKPLFSTPHFVARYDAAARVNLARSLAALGG
jgi:predicted metal-dependent HD superfamily phosphohydrolase